MVACAAGAGPRRAAEAKRPASAVELAGSRLLFRKAKSHSGLVLNERADLLADCGRHNLLSLGTIREWLPAVAALLPRSTGLADSLPHPFGVT